MGRIEQATSVFLTSKQQKWAKVLPLASRLTNVLNRDSEMVLTEWALRQKKKKEWALRPFSGRTLAAS